jgi:hypothetical protein
MLARDQFLKNGRKSILEWNPVPADDSSAITRKKENVRNKRFEIRINHLILQSVSHHENHKSKSKSKEDSDC